MAEYLSPGVFIEEVDTGPRPIEGVSTSTAGMVGVTERGPEGVATLVTSFPDFRRQFGGFLNQRVYTDSWYLPHAVEGFFNNGGRRLYVIRVLPNGTNGATFATTRLFDRGDTEIDFSTALASRAERGEGFIIVEDANEIAPGNWLLIADGAASEYHQVATGNAIALGTPVMRAQEAETTVVGYTLMNAGTATTLPGGAEADDTAVTLATSTGLNEGNLLRIGTGRRGELVVIVSISGTNVTLQYPLAYDHADDTPVQLLTPTEIGTTFLVHNLSPDDRVAIIEELISGAEAIGFDGPPFSEYHRLGNVSLVDISAKLAFNHNRGASVTALADPGIDGDRELTEEADLRATRLTLTRRDDLDPGSTLRLTSSAEDEEEFVIIETIESPRGMDPDPGVVTLSTPLRRAYPMGTTVRPFADTGPGTTETFLARDVNAGEQGLVLTDDDSFTPEKVIRIEEPTSALVEYHVVDTSKIDLAPLDSTLSNTHNASLDVDGRSPILRVQAIDRGAWGNFLRIIIDDDDPILETTPIDSADAGDPNLTLTSVVGIEVGTILEFYRLVDGTRQTIFLQKVESITGNMVGFGEGNLAQNVTTDMRVRAREFVMTIELVQINPRTGREQVDVEMSETLRQLSMDPRHSRYVVRVVGRIFINENVTPRRADGRTDGESRLIRVADELDPDDAETTLRVGAGYFARDAPRWPLASGRALLNRRR